MVRVVRAVSVVRCDGATLAWGATTKPTQEWRPLVIHDYHLQYWYSDGAISVLVCKHELYMPPYGGYKTLVTNLSPSG